jgi:hypothetical protein
MKPENQINVPYGKSIVKRCHRCGEITESYTEISKCPCCKKSFLPLNYFSKIHTKNSTDYNKLFCSSEELQEEDLIKGIYVLW